ncbi:MAG: glycosyltransferase family 4 protein [Pseudobacter sp.]|uniref:glycosyltransferase family 4 protein n=1 Tax=Pseudobacter sp. TaxID=2045420 RepID=UPI003F7D6B3D
MKQRVAFISEHASPLATLGGVDNGGQNVYVAELSTQLSSMGYEIDIFTRKDREDLPEIINWKPGIRVIHIAAGPTLYIPKEQLMDYMGQFADRMKQFIKSNKILYKLIHAHFFMSAMVAAELKKELQIPYLVTFHALGKVRRLHQQEADRFPAERIPVESFLVRDADAIVAECPQDRQDLITHYRAAIEKIHVVPCGFNPTEFYPVDKQEARERLGLRRSEKVVLQLGRMVPRKGVDDVIRAVGALQGQVKKLKLIIVGGEADLPDPAATPEIRRLMQVSKECRTEQCVQFAGRKDRDILKYYYSAADVFVSVPWYEPFGITPLEAMACGTPVVGSNVGGIKYSVVDRLTGFLVQPKDPVNTARMIWQLLEDRFMHNYMRKNGIQRVNKMFTWSKVAESIHTVYEKVANRQVTSDPSGGIYEESSVYRQRRNADQEYSFQR